MLFCQLRLQCKRVWIWHFTFFQYILAKHISSRGGPEQLSWLLNGSIQLLSPFDRSALQLVTPLELNESLDLFQSLAMLQSFVTCSHHIRRLVPFSNDLNGLVAYVILFYTSSSMKPNLEEKEKIENLFEAAKHLLSFSCGTFEG